MSISTPFIQRPVMTTLLVVGLLMFGILGYFSMPVNDLPNVDYPTIQVTANLSGASPETMASAVAEPLESNFANIPGIDNMSSSNTLGQTQITLQFNLSRDIDSAAQDVQAAISKTQKKLPTQMQNPPYYKKVNPADSPIMYITLSSDTMPMSDVDEYAENTLAQRLSMLNGVAQVDVYGSQKFAVRIQVNPLLMAQHNLSFDNLISAIENGNVNLPTGTLNGDVQTRTLQVQGQLFNASEFRPLIVTYENGQALRLDSVANVIDSVQNNQVGSWLNHKRNITLAIRRQPGVNTLLLIDNIKQLLPQFIASSPKALQLNVIFDRSQSIKASINEVKMNLIISIALVVLVIFLFLKNFLSTLIPAAVLPVTIIGAFAVMAALGFSIDTISLLGLTLAVGFFVDDAIVMLENILRHMEEGKTAYHAALDGAKEIGFTIVSMTLSLAAAFIPLVFMPGLLGRLLHEFSVTLVVSIFISALVALTLTPMMASRILKIKQVNHGFLEKFDHWFTRMEQRYSKGLTWCLAHQRLILQIWFACILLTAVFYWIVPKGFIPSEDTGMLSGTTEASLDTGFAAMVKLQQQAADIVQKNPNVESVISSVTGTNAGRFIIRLKPRGDRASWETILAELRKQTAHIPGLKVYLQNNPPITLGGKSTKSQYQFTMQATDLKQLFQYSNAVYNKIRTLPGLIDVTTDAELNSPQLEVTIDRDKAASMHVSMYAIQNVLANALGTTQVSTIYGQSDQFEVILEVAPELQQSAEIVKQIYVASDDGNLVPLGALGTFTDAVGPAVINHQNQTPSLTVSFNLKPGVSIGKAVNDVNAAVASLHLPSSISTGFQGNAKAFQDSLQGYGLLIFLAVAVIYIVLGILYESFIHPLTILSTIPTAGVGALLTLIVASSPLDLYGFIGLIMLIGIVKKNAIMMIDFAVESERAGMTSTEAIKHACLMRFRPIMMTTFAAFMGSVPIVLSFGAGGEARRSLGLAVTGGLIASQALTLFSTPVIYLYLDRLQTYLQTRKDSSAS